MFLPPEIITVLQQFEPAFTKRTYEKGVIILLGTILGRGRRTVTAALRQMGLQDSCNWAKYHHVLNRASWSGLQVAGILLRILVQSFVSSQGTVEMVIDETLERRWGRKITKRGHWRDPLASSKGMHVSSSGLRWVVIALVVKLPWSNRYWALPCLSMLATPPKVNEQLGRRHKTLAQWAAQGVKWLRRSLPQRSIKMIGDGAYSVIELGLTCRQLGVSLIAPLRLDARLFAPPAVRSGPIVGRPRLVGERLPTLEHIALDPTTAWQQATLAWYGGGQRTLDWVSDTAWWYSTGTDPLPLRWVLTRDPQGHLPTRAYLSTDPDQDPLTIIEDVVKRWSIEVTFQESRAHLGLETQRQWSDQAIERTTPALLALFSLITLFNRTLFSDQSLPFSRAAWYPKPQPSFADLLALVRRALWADFNFQTSPFHPDLLLIPRPVLERLVFNICY
jgi:hypothetical protein